MFSGKNLFALLKAELDLAAGEFLYRNLIFDFSIKIYRLAVLAKVIVIHYGIEIK